MKMLQRREGKALIVSPWFLGLAAQKLRKTRSDERTIRRGSHNGSASERPESGLEMEIRAESATETMAEAKSRKVPLILTPSVPA